MAELGPQDVVKQAQSVDEPSSSDVSATQIPASAARAAPNHEHSISTVFIPTSSDTVLLDNLNEDDTAPKSDARYPVTGFPLNAGVDDSTESLPTTNIGSRANGIRSSEGHGSDFAEDGSVRSAGLDGSVESDTDTSKADQGESGVKDLGEGQEQTRPYSLKKSASFKPVSVTKNFLAKAGTTAVPVSKASTDKVNGTSGAISGAAALAAPRPRLVAKTNSGIRSSVPKALTPNSRAGKGTGPDPNQVWNRNRVATPQATPKHLTDEELRQQYGIQLASRPQEDGDGKEAKWADIDDDEDDWAPDTIEWNDGTKINLAQVDQNAAIVEQAAAAAAAKEKEIEAANQKLLAAKATTTVGPNATVLRLGSGIQMKSSGLVLKGPSDKPTLVSKPSSSNAVKSPWAALPPVDKVSPAPVNPPVQPQPSRFVQKDAHGFDSMSPQPAHTKEIAADDFSRFARDTQNGGPRELFNSQSGRYEPVNESRRASVRKEQSFRQPSVLQRPTADQHGPAEPSAAFQARSGQQEAGAWSRRRTSSNVSGDSGRFGRRLSLGKGLDGRDIYQRRDSQYDPSPLTPGLSSVQSQGNSAGHSPTLPQQTSTGGSVVDSPVQSQVKPVEAPIPVAAVVEDAVAIQKKLMREKREAAIKRKQEEDATEEAAKKERIRIKMEMLGLTDEKLGKKGSNDRAAPASVVLLKESKDPVQSSPKSPPKPPVPNASGEPQQYGLMKVHAPQPIASQQTNAIAEKKVPDAVASGSDTGRNLQPVVEAQVNGTSNQRTKDSYAVSAPETRLQELVSDPRLQDSRKQAWTDLPQGPNSYPTWHNGGGMTTHSATGGNLWGSPSNHRALGNGDFQQNVQRPQIRQPPYPQHVLSPQPQPIGPPKHAQQSRGPSTSGRSADSVSRSTIEESQTVPAFPPTDTLLRSLTNPMSLTQPPTVPSNQHRPGLNHMGSGAAPRMPQPIEPPRTGLAAWANASATLAKQDAEMLETSKREYAARQAEEQQTGVRQAPKLPQFNETWRQVKRGEEVGSRKLVAVTKSQSGEGTHNQDEQMAVDAHRPVNALVPQVRSRYQDIFEQGQRTITHPSTFPRPSSPTPPPPDSADHPAYVAVSQRPLVNLPGSRPRLTEKPIVRLPPVMSAQPKQLHAVLESQPPSSHPLRTAPQPLVTNSSWQDRFNGLFDRKMHSPERKFADVVDFSSSKVPLELAAVDNSAAVTLPPQDEIESKVLFSTSEQTVKDIEDEDALFEERDFGSVPIVRIPAQAPVHAWNPSTPKVYRARFKGLTDFDITTVVAFSPAFLEAKSANVPVTIRIGGMPMSKTRYMPRSAGTVANRHHSHSSRGKSRQSHKPRDGSAAHSSPKSTQGPGRSPLQAGSNQQQRPKPNSGNSTWARRISGVTQ